MHRARSKLLKCSTIKRLPSKPAAPDPASKRKRDGDDDDNERRPPPPLSSSNVANSTEILMITREIRYQLHTTTVAEPVEPPGVAFPQEVYYIRHKARRPISAPLSAAEQAAEDLIWAFNPLEYQ